MNAQVTPCMRLQTHHSHTRTPPREPCTVPRLEPQEAWEIGVKSRGFGVNIRDWTGIYENGKLSERGYIETKTV